MNIHPDILFFSLHSLMIENADKSIFICDSGKFNRRSLYCLVLIDDIDMAVFDEPWEDLNTKCRII